MLGPAEPDPGAGHDAESLRCLERPRLRPTCIMDDGTLAAKWSKSPTVDESLVSAIEQTFASSAKALDSIESNTTGKRVKGFDFALRNIYVVTLSDEGLRGVRRQYLRDDCEEVVIGNLRAGADVCQSEEVLEADLVYKTNVQDQLGASVKGGIAGRATGSIASDQQPKNAMRCEATISSWSSGWPAPLLPAHGQRSDFRERSDPRRRRPSITPSGHSS